MILFTKYAHTKFQILEEHQFPVLRDAVIAVVENPDAVDTARLPLYIARKNSDNAYVLKVVYKKEAGAFKIITFYPVLKNENEKE